MRVAEVSRILGLSNKRTYELIAAGTIPSARVSHRSIRVPRAALNAWLAAQNDIAIEQLRKGTASKRGG